MSPFYNSIQNLNLNNILGKKKRGQVSVVSLFVSYTVDNLPMGMGYTMRYTVYIMVMDKTNNKTAASAGAKRPKILYIEDDIFMIELLSQELMKGGFEPVNCRLNADALKSFKEKKPDLILLDLLLPDGNGLDFLREVRSMPGGPDTKVIILSNVAEAGHKESAKRLGVDDYLIKANYSLPEIIQRIRSVLSNKSS
jgi:CheY-like chemotaxis protein